jgi:Neuraminidase-like domain/Salmonella virulence plasmid 28.1kDa A protein
MNRRDRKGTANTETFAIAGRVFSAQRAGVGGLRVEVVDKNVGGDVLLAAGTTDARGGYSLPYTLAKVRKQGKDAPDIQARVFRGKTFLGASEVRYNAKPSEALDVLLPAAAADSLPAEYETLTGALAAHYKGKLRDLQETDKRQDITYLANKTGWDARAVAFEVLAEQFSARTAKGTRQAGIEAPFFYALFRAGLPANEDALYQITAKTAADIWKKAIAQGVIPAKLEPRISQAADQFEQLVVARALDGPALTGVSPLKDILEISLGKDAARRKRFAQIYAKHRDDPAELWATVRKSLGEAAEKRLRLDGQLGYLTLNNAPLMRKLHAAAGRTGLTDTLSLAEQGYYRPEKWRDLVGNDAIPSEIPGEAQEQKRTRYAETLAAQVRLSFPTMVLAQMVKEGETPVASGTRDQVHAFLAGHQGKFEIGMQPVQRYIARSGLKVPAEVSKEITRIQRVYQITPSHGAMNALLRSGLDSAMAVSRYDREQFVRTHKDELGGEANARLTHAKAQQVHNIVLNLAASYLVARTAPQVGVHSPAKYNNSTPELIAKAQELVAANKAATLQEALEGWASESPDNAADVIPYATLEKLFGEMDYCACEHCRSVLSPAAYLVDLLQFIARDELSADKRPLKILLDRRPDIEHLPLTCDNTNTALPYIDLVNETLEYYITNDLSLKAYEGHSTEDTVTSEELLATPRFVQDTAYEILAGKHQPAPLLPPTTPLPFHQPLENLRRYFDKFEAPLPEVMEALRTNDALERPVAADPTNPVEYGWRDILMEELRLSRAEYARLTKGALTLNELYGFKPEMSIDPVLTDLSMAKAFTRRMEITYTDIVNILKTRFVNPNSVLVPKLEKLGAPFVLLKALKDGTMSDADKVTFDELIKNVVASEYGGDVKKWVNDHYARIMRLITLTDPSGKDNPCSFDELQFRYSDPAKIATPIRAFEFVRMLRFIRLWKKLGWSMEQTDKAIAALYPEGKNPDSLDDAVNLQRLDEGFLILLPRLGVVKRLMKILKLKPNRDLLPLLACFAPIDTLGTASLYRQMFLYPAPFEKESPFADNGSGDYLTKDEKLSAHVEALRAAFLLTDDEFRQITAWLGYTDGTLLKLDTIGAIFRRGWLARKLKLSVRELLLLTQLAAIDPFAPPDPAHPPILRLIDVVNRLRAASLKPEQALYLVWNHDISGKSAPQDGEILEFARTLRAAFGAIETEFALSDDPGGQIARARMALVYGSDATNLFFGLLDNTLVSEVPYDHDQASLEQAILDAAPDRLAYDDFGKRLSYTGVMTKAARDALQAASGSPKFHDAVHSADPVKKNLFDENQKVVKPFFDRYPELQPLYELYAFFGELRTEVSYSHPEKTLAPAILEAGAGRIAYDPTLERLSFKGVMGTAVHDALMLVPGSTAELKNALGKLLSENKSAIENFFQDFATRYPGLAIDTQAYLAANDSATERRTLFLAAFLPELKSRRKRQQAQVAVSAAAKADIAFASALLDDKTVLNPAAAPPLADLEDLPAALDDLTAMETAGLSARFYAAATADGAPDGASDAEANLAYPGSGAGALPFNPGSGIWSGYLEAPENGFYNFSIEPGAAGGAGAGSATLTLNGEDKLLEKNAEAWSNTTAIELRAGTLYPITLKVENITAGLKVRWQTKGRGWEVIAARYLYPETLTGHLRATYVRFLKAISLATGFQLKASEMAYFAAHPDYRIGGRGWLNSLPVAGTADGVIATKLLAAFEALLDFAGLKAELSPKDERLLTVLKDPNAVVTSAKEIKDSLLLALTRWDGALLDALLLRFGKHLQAEPDQADRSALKDLGTFMRVHRAYAPVKKIGVSASALIAAATNEPQAEVVRAFKAALRARYEESDWLNVLKPINDQMRSLQRDALVAYILHQMRADPKSAHIDTAEKLFEYFLMDVQMDSCMQTSRIRHALSSVQLFIERCFLNLETGVEPSVFEDKHRKQWEWMKRYRVWEANRKVFLWPENWVEPELRGGQSPFFKEAMSELLQSDITEDRAATALLNYLSKLEEVAKLEPCGIHFVEGDAGTTDDIAHVVARTPGANRKYFYRRREIGLWTPWEQIKLDIEDNPVIPVVWNSRLFLFWLKILKQAPLVKPKTPAGATLAECAPADIVSADLPQVTVQAMLCWSEYYNGKWQPAKTSDANLPTTLDSFGPTDFNRRNLLLSVAPEGDELRVTIDGEGWSTFLLYNTHSLPAREEDVPQEVLALMPEIAYRNVLTKGTTLAVAYWTTAPRPVLNNLIAHRTVEPRHDLQNAWIAPFIYWDSRHAFYVTTEKTFPRVQQSSSYYSAADSGLPASIGPLVMPEHPRPGPGPVELAVIAADSASSMKRLVSEDAYINKGLSMAGTVSVHGVEIGPAGRVGGAMAKQ